MVVLFQPGSHEWQAGESRCAMTPEGEAQQEVHLAQDWAVAPGILGEQHLGHPQLLEGPPLQSAPTDSWAGPAAVMDSKL